MPWVVREAVRDINRAVGRRWHAIDPLLPDPGTLPTGCGEPLVVTGDNGRMAGLGVCVHQHIPPQSLNQTWGAADRFTLVPRLPGQDIAAAADLLLAQWRDHLAGIGATRGPDTSASVVWPSLDITGVQALLRHGLQPLTVIAARTRPSGPPPAAAARLRRDDPRRPARPTKSRCSTWSCGSSATTCTSAGRYGGRATARLVRDEIRDSLARADPWTWLAERNGRAVGLLVAQPPQDAGWIAGMTSKTPAAYLQTMFVDGQERGTGIGAALVRNLHARLDGMGVAVTLLHHSQVNPLSAPFWYRMGYRPLWTSWEARPASALR